MQVAMVMGVSLTAESPRSARQREARKPERTGPVIPPGFAVTVAGALAPESPAVVCTTTVMV